MASWCKKNFYALGRLKAGEMNKTEAAYKERLLSLLHEGEILWFKFEGVKLRLADNTFYSPDFAVLNKSGEIEMHEVKGARVIFQDDAKVKIKVAAELYPFKFIAAFPIPKKKGGGWEFDEY